MARKSRDKGARGELEVRDILRSHGYLEARRGQQYCGIAGDADVVGLPGVHIEVKRVESLKLESAMEQSRRDARDGEMPTVWHRKSRRPWVVVMDAEDFMRLYRYAEPAILDAVESADV